MYKRAPVLNQIYKISYGLTIKLQQFSLFVTGFITRIINWWRTCMFDTSTKYESFQYEGETRTIILLIYIK